MRFVLTFLLLCAACGSSPAGPPADAGSPLGADGGASPSDAGVPATPITAPAGTWTWVDFPDSSCDDGSPTGIGVNRSDAGTNLVVYLEGGGACWDSNTCFAFNS